MYFAILFYNFFHMTKMLQNLINKALSQQMVDFDEK